jgi:hypothetical protein
VLELFFDETLERSVIVTEFCHHGFVFGELLLKLLDLFELRRFKTPVFGSPLVKGGAAIAHQPAINR